MDVPEEKPRRSVGALILLVVDLLLALCLVFQLAFVVPVFGALFKDFGTPLPASTRLVLNLAGAINAFHGLGFSLLFCLVPGTIIWMYLSLQRLGDRKTLVIALGSAGLALLVLMGSITGTLFLPMGGMESGVNAPPPSAVPVK